MGDFDGRLNHFRRRVQQLRALAGGEPGDSGRCVRAGVPTASGAVAVRDYLVAGKDSAGERQSEDDDEPRVIRCRRLGPIDGAIRKDWNGLKVAGAFAGTS